MKSFKVRFASAFGITYLSALALLNLAEYFINDKLTFYGTFSTQSLTFAGIMRVVIFLAVLILSIVCARVCTKCSLIFANKAANQCEDKNYFDKFFLLSSLVFAVLICIKIYFAARKLNTVSTALMLMGINDFTFVLMIMRYFTYIANIIYIVGGFCALTGCASYAKQLIDKTIETEEIDK